MSSVLESVEWGKPALSLISKFESHDFTEPSMLFIRHSERPIGFYATLNETGKQASYEYGKQLTRFKQIRLYHTYQDRTKETAQEIQRALNDNQIDSKIAGQVNLRTAVDPEKGGYNMMKIFASYGLDGTPSMEQRIKLYNQRDNPFKDNFLKWVSGCYSQYVLRPSLDFVKELTSIVMVNFESLEKGGLDLYVCHDTWVAALLFHWFGYLPESWVSFLEGFLVQPLQNRLNIILPSGKRMADYPYWWK